MYKGNTINDVSNIGEAQCFLMLRKLEKELTWLRFAMHPQDQRALQYEEQLLELKKKLEERLGINK